MGLDWLTATAIAELTGGTWLNKPPDDWRPQTIGYHARVVRPRSLLIPKSASFHYCIELSKVETSKLHACALLVDDRFEEPSPLPRLAVSSVRGAVAAIAKRVRERYQGTICAVTGSVGKSSTFTLLHHALSRQGSCAASYFDHNTLDGISAQTANLSDERFAVLEVALSAAPLCGAILRPHLAVLTAVAPAHLAYTSTGTLAKTAERKAGIFIGLEPGGTAILNRSIPFYERVSEVARRHAPTVVTYGDHPEAEVRLLDYSLDEQLVRASVNGEEIEYPLGMNGRHMALNSLAALAAIRALGLNWRKAASEFGFAQQPPGRGRPYRARIGGKHVLLIDDAYNANPASMAAALELLAELTPSPGGKRIAVLADMLELGPGGPRFHAELVQPIVKAGIDRVYAAGELMTHLWDQLPAHLHGRKVETVEELLPILQNEISENDVILFKGSHASNLFTVVQALRSLHGFTTSAAFSTASAETEVSVARSETFVQRLLRRARGGGSTRSMSRAGRPRKSTYTLTLCGDTSLGDFYLTRLRDGGAAYRRLCEAPLSFFEHVVPLVADSDDMIVNLETCLVTGTTSPFEGEKPFLGWDDPERTLGALKEIGVKAVNLANNHSMDFGSDGLLETIARLKGAGITAFGAGRNRNAASRPFMRRIKVEGQEKALFIVGAFEFRQGYKERYAYYATASLPGVNPLSRRRLVTRIARLRTTNPDALIVAFPHWNRNYVWAGDREIETSSALVDAGADLVIGHGLHVLGQCHWSEAGTQVLSLGNFIFNSPGRHAAFAALPFSLIARLDIKPETEGWSAVLKLYPILTDNRRTGFQVQAVDRAMLASVYALLAERAPDASVFRDHFETADDKRGLHIRLNRPISPRFAHAPKRATTAA